MINPLQSHFTLPPFSKIKSEHIVPAITQALADCRAEVSKVISQNCTYTWETLCQPLAEVEDRLHRIFSPVNHLVAVKDSPELRKAYDQALPLLSEYHTWIGQHQGLYQAYRDLRDSEHYSTLNTVQKKAVNNVLRDFMLSGIHLPQNQQSRYATIVARISELSTHYNHHVLDATMGWSKLISEITELSGIPDNTLAMMKDSAEVRGQKGWLVTLDMPVYQSITTYSDNPSLREEIYHAFNTRASEMGPNAGIWNNGHIMEDILNLRHELALLLGFESHAHKSLATRMAENPQHVLDFLTDLTYLIRPQGEEEIEQLGTFAKIHYHTDELNPWDITYYSEKQKQYLYRVSDEELRPYFPENKVIKGMFDVVARIYGITVKECSEPDVWHRDVRFFEIYDEHQILCGSFYLDLYAREHKRAGAWMDECIGRMRLADGSLQNPVAYLVCNFSRPVNGQPALLTHNDVATLFHEFGHGLHHLLTRVETAGVAGIRNVPWDAVELPSQLMEKWSWQPETLSIISGHFETGEPLPQSLMDNIIESRNHHSALFLLRQLELALFDFRLHLDYKPEKGEQILTTLADVKKQVAVIPSPSWSRFPHAFSHIFGGGYDAGYYSYLWADVLAADAFSRFIEEGIFNRDTGEAFRNTILANGGAVEPMFLFKDFRGRAPSLEPLLTCYNII